MNDLICPACRGSAQTASTYPLHCGCGGLWSLAPGVVVPDSGNHTTPLWRDPVETDLVWKREDLQETGSFKDRGAQALVPYAVACGARGFVLDSSGSAALAAAAAAARAGLPVTVHTPASLPRVKSDALRVLGADVVAEGSREDAAARAREGAQTVFYLSHVYHPGFSAGTAGAGKEALTQNAPPLWVLPVGNGSLFLGLARALAEARRTDGRLVAVQAASCAGLVNPGTKGVTMAAGIAIGNPPRREEILEAVETTGGAVLTVSEDEIETAWRALWQRGVAAEKASAATLAGVYQLRARGEAGAILGWLTGSGLRDA